MVSGLKKSCLDDPGTGRGIGEVLRLGSKLNGPGDTLGRVRFQAQREDVDIQCETSNEKRQ